MKLFLYTDEFKFNNGIWLQKLNVMKNLRALHSDLSLRFYINNFTQLLIRTDRHIHWPTRDYKWGKSVGLKQKRMSIVILELNFKIVCRVYFWISTTDMLS